ncbi:MAG TPA: 4-hydroxy-tetrahydrodipicolinate reductase [Parvularculaceae bacterium]|nr:4-hydroxy-tetrahydrodipicolinate reductase [Parvularculaceae bacterium]HRX39626.1 4-hydroxy-tetrahydrodipicolinate reductase [Parvularculaceae bacterium]
MGALKILVAGAGGRMGRAVIAEVAATPGVTLAGGFDRPEGAVIGADLGQLAGLDPVGLAVASSISESIEGASVVIDFTSADASVENVKAAAAAKVACVIGSTGFLPEQEKELEALARKIPIVKSGNMSLGVNLLAALVEQAARILPDDYDIEIVEAHHRLKVDAPSGTALMLGRAAAEGRGVDLTERSVRARDGLTGARRAGDIGFAVVRGGGIVGQHDVLFAGSQEVLTFSHTALDRSLFARGAVAAAKWVAGKQAGLYSMRDVLGLG